MSRSVVPACLAVLTAIGATPVLAQGEPVVERAEIADWSGAWFTEAGAFVEISGFVTGPTKAASAPGAGGPPMPFLDPAGPWRDQPRAQLIELLGRAGVGKADAWGYPLMMMSLTPIQFFVTPRETLILTSYRDLRLVMTDGRALSAPEDRWATAWGESVGRWEGDTLIIETVGVRQPGLFFLSPPFSENARYTERLRKVAPDRIEGEMTVVDPDALTAPWTVPLAYVRADGLDRLVYDTFTNDRSELDGEAWTILPAGEAATP